MKTSVLASLTLGEKGELLDQVLAAAPELREQVEELAQRRLADEDRDAVAADVEWAMGAHDIDELNGRAGYHSGRGYVDPGEAADEILDEALQPFLDDLARRAKLGLASAATKMAVGVLCGLYACRDASSGACWTTPPTMRSSGPAIWLTSARSSTWRLPVNDLVDLVPEWGRLFHAATSAGPAR